MTVQEFLNKCEEVEKYASEGPWDHWWCGDDECNCHAVESGGWSKYKWKHKIERQNSKKPEHSVINIPWKMWMGADGEYSNDAEFIAHARNTYTQLIELNRVMYEALEEIDMETGRNATEYEMRRNIMKLATGAITKCEKIVKGEK